MAIFPPHVKKWNKILNKLTLCLFLSLFFFSGCTTSEKGDECLFLEYVMIREKGLYVLMGSKPMSSFPYENGFPETDEQIHRYYQVCTRDEKSERRSGDHEEYEDFAASCSELNHLHIQKLWRRWKEKMTELVGPRYRFVIRRQPFGERPKGGLFINVPNVLFILNRYYSDFSKEYGGQFDPQVVLDELDNEDSVFWERVFQSDFLKGLLFGYGAKNSFVFEWQSNTDVHLPKILHKRQSIDPLLKRNITVSDLQLPPAMVYSVGDDVLKKYCHERKAIIREFKGKDFELTVKQWLKK